MNEKLAHLNKALERNGSRQRFSGCREGNLPMLALVYEDVCLELGPPTCCVTEQGECDAND